jgi:transcriptional regulator with XRE-family HTH domain
METHQLTASLFADKIGVQRSSISHILSGRNKPSLDFILKVTAVFSDVDMYWLLNDVGEFPKQKTNSPTQPLNKNLNLVPSTSGGEKKIKRIVVFYEDGTFDEYHK